MRLPTHLIASTCILLNLNLSHLTSQNAYPLIVDKDLSHIVGAHDMLFLHKIIYDTQDKYIPIRFNNEEKFSQKSLGIAYRLTKLLFLDFQQDFLITLTNHEAFGHGSRHREFGFEGNAISVSLYAPFGNGGGFLTPGNTPPNYTIQKDIMADNIGGVESNVVMGDILASSILLKDSMHYRESLIYFLANYDQLFYIWSDHLRDNTGGDMRGYVSKLNDYYTPNQQTYTTDHLANQSLLSLANPLNAYGIYAVFYKYLVKGESNLQKLPMISIGKYRYLPSFNVNLSPFGTQYIWSNYIRIDNRLIQADFGLSDQVFNDSYQLKLRYFNAIKNERFRLNFYSEVWSQPELSLITGAFIGSKNKIGGLLKSDLYYKPSSVTNQFNLFMQVGYKTQGFTIGEPVDQNLILRAGIGLNL